VNLHLSTTCAAVALTRWLRGCLFCAGILLPVFPAHSATNAIPVPQPGTLAYHLATNAVAHAAGFTGSRADMVEFQAPFSLRLERFFAPAWSAEFWLKDVQGLSATAIGFSDVYNGQGLPTMVSPRHYLCATHMHSELRTLGFLDVNNRVYWRKTLQRVDLGNDTSVGLLAADLPASVGFLPVLPENYTNYLPVVSGSYVQGIGMNQDMRLFGEPMTFANGAFINWDSRLAAPLGLTTNWNVTIRGGDSSNPALLLIGHQLVLVSHNYWAGGGPNYARQFHAINEKMHLLSTNNQVGSDYQLTTFPLTNWPVIH